MRSLVIGAGAVGAYFGGRLAQAGHDVAFVARGRSLEALRSRGLRILSPRGDAHLPQVEASDDTSTFAPADLILVAVKAWQVAEVAKSLSPLLSEEGCVLPLQNGVDAPAHLAAALDRPGAQTRVLGGLCKIISHLEEPGVVRHVGATPTITLGELDVPIDQGRSARVERICESLEAAGIRAEVPSSIRAAMWEKFLFISAMSSMGAAARVPLGRLRSNEPTRSMLQQLMEEILEVAMARQIPIAPDIVASCLGFVDSLPAESTASMQRDLMAGRPSELEAQTGAVVRLGEESGVPTPLHRTLYHLLLPQEEQARAASRG